MSRSDFDKLQKEYQEGLDRFNGVNVGDTIYFPFGFGDLAEAIVLEVHPEDKYLLVDDMSLTITRPSREDRITRINVFLTEDEFLKRYGS